MLPAAEDALLAAEEAALVTLLRAEEAEVEADEAALPVVPEEEAEPELEEAAEVELEQEAWLGCREEEKSTIVRYADDRPSGWADGSAG